MKTKEQKRKHFDRIAPARDRWKQFNRYYYDSLESLLSFLIPAHRSVLEIGCGTGDLLLRVQPSSGVGVDFSPGMIKKATEKYPKERYPFLEFRVDDAEDLHINETFDYVVMSDLLGELTDIWAVFRNLRRVVRSDSRVVITCFNALWEPVLRLGERLKLKMPQDYQNWLSLPDIVNLLTLNGFEVVTKEYALLCPIRIPLLAPFLNRVIATLPILRKLCLVVHLVARPLMETVPSKGEYSVSVVVACRNERGNIKPAVERLPMMGTHTELIFVDGDSNDGTVEEIEKAIKQTKGKKDIKLLHQVPRRSDGADGSGKMLKLGKGDAIRKGFARASGDILMILDGDLTVPPEELPKFYQALTQGRGELIMGSRLVYPMEKEAMRFLNKLANKSFGHLFTWLLGQRIKDTLCGTKVLFKRDYEKIAANRAFFGEFDPFGDFDLIFGAAKQNLKITEIPIRYREREYGDIKIERFRHGLLLMKMSLIAAVKLKLR